MKIPKSLKLPRKLKKELKKGFTRNICNNGPVWSKNPDIVSCSMYSTVSYSGSNTKSFWRLCKFSRREEKRMYEKMIQDAIKKQFDWLDNDVSDIRKITTEDLKQFQNKVFSQAIPKSTMQNIASELWKNTTIKNSAPDDPVIASCIGLYCNDMHISVDPANGKDYAVTNLIDG